MMNEKIKQLKDAGIDVNKMMDYLTEGNEIKIRLKNGEVVIQDDVDELTKKILEDGFIKSSKTYRRFVMAQMFEALNYRSWNGQYSGYNDFVDHMHNWNYQIDFLIREVNAINHIRKDGDMETYKEYTRCCSITDIKSVCLAIYNETKKRYVDHYSTSLQRMCDKTANVVSAMDYNEMYYALKRLRAYMVYMPTSHKKVTPFKNVYKKIGAYWTCKNLIMHHDCKVKIGTIVYDKYDSMKILESKAREYFVDENNGYKMFGFMKKLIKDNKFDYYEARRKWEAKRK